MTWDELFAAVSPTMINEASDLEFRSAIDSRIRDKSYRIHRKDSDFKDKEISRFSVHNEDFQTTKVQLRALGLIDKSIKTRSVKDTENYWTLTPYGDHVMNKLRAIRREDLLSEADNA